MIRYPIFALPTTNNEQPLLSSHYGSRSTENHVRSVQVLRAFPSHYGSRSTYFPTIFRTKSHVSIPLWFSLNLKFMAWRDPIVVFPSHIGSRSTLRNPERRELLLVSIPHWFSLNSVTGRTSSQGTTRFHPTLVLAQPENYDGLSYVLSRFHPTLVLAQRGSIRSHDRARVSIPHSQLMHFELTKRGRRKWIEESAAEELRTKWMK